jgi:signal transduction histidine kinase/CheY-like chemotaxis protein
MDAGYDPILVALSYVISVFGSYSALRLAVKIPGASREKLPVWLGASAIAMGGGAIWSMHFIGMLAYRTPFRITYDPLITAASMAIAIVTTGCGLYLVGRNPASRGRLLGASVFTGLGVASMHYTGMYAMKMPAHMSWHPGLVLLSVVIAVGASFAALWLAFNLHGNLQRIGSAFVMGLAVCGMHYTGMFAMRMTPMEHGEMTGRAGLGPSDLALGVFLVTVVGILLLSATQDQELEQRNRELDEARRQAELQSQFKSRFLAGVSHELRTPLTAILGFAELLEQELQDRLEARHKEFMELITASARHLLGLVNEVLDLSRIEAGHLTISPARVEIRELVNAAVAGLKSLAALRGVELKIKVPDGLPPLHVDPMRIKQVLYNLLANAIKFTPSGGSVSLAVRAEGERMYLAVADTGIGIQAEDLPRLFQEFQRLAPPPGAPPAPEGTGLGLALSRRLVEMHGGEIAVESVPGSGSTFTVCLPISQRGEAEAAGSAAATGAPAPPADGKSPDGAPAAPARILLVEDDPTVRLLIRLVLEHHGHTVLEAADAAEARRQLETEKPDLVLLDIHFPGGGGEMLLSEIRARPELQGVPMLAVTAAAMEGDRERLLAHGFDGYISKPIELSSFGAEVDCWLRKAN